MRLHAICVVLLIPAAGCGTVANQVHMQKNGGAPGFGGVHHDLAHLGPVDGEHADTGRMLMCAIDLPFSAVGDLVLWPYTALFTHINRPSPDDLQPGMPMQYGGPAIVAPTAPATPLPQAPAPQPLPGKY